MWRNLGAGGKIMFVDGAFYKSIWRQKQRRFHNWRFRCYACVRLCYSQSYKMNSIELFFFDRNFMRIRKPEATPTTAAITIHHKFETENRPMKFRWDTPFFSFPESSTRINIYSLHIHTAHHHQPFLSAPPHSSWWKYKLLGVSAMITFAHKTLSAVLACTHIAHNW